MVVSKFGLEGIGLTMGTRARATLCVLAILISGFATVQSSGHARAAGAHVYPGKRITISLARQRLRAWVGNRVLLVTPVTTGNASLPTPTGYFHIFEKRSPYTFVSPWPRSSPDWYPPSEVSYALEFLGGGYFIHDAPWRGVFGRGSNAGSQPGTNYGGTHGCVNVPYYAARWLYSWADVGTLVHIVR
jgi:lipoprotein-anchoring transpeptidase ErfK/SrfK